MEEVSLLMLPEEESKLRLGELTPFSFDVAEVRSLPSPGRCNCSNLGVGPVVGT
jgi:hypothetical protein